MDAPDAERRAHAHRVLNGQRESMLTLSVDARVMYALGLLICDDEGRIPKDGLDEAAADPDALVRARQLLLDTNLLPELSSGN